MAPDTSALNEKDMIITFSIQRYRFKSRNEYSGMILDASGRIIFQVKGTTIEDEIGTIRGKTERARTGTFGPNDLNVLDSGGKFIGAIIKTRQRVPTGWLNRGKPAQYSLINDFNQVVAIAEPTDTQRLSPSYEIMSMDGSIFAKVRPAESEDFYQVDILQHNLDPLVILFYLASAGNPKVFAAN